MNYMYEEDDWGSGDSEAVVVSPTIIVADNDENTTNSQADNDSNHVYDQVEDEDDAVVLVQPPLAMEFDTTMSGMMGALYEIQRRGDEMLTTISRQQKRLTALEDEVEIVEVKKNSLVSEVKLLEEEVELKRAGLVPLNKQMMEKKN